MRMCTAAVFTVVAALFLTGLFLDINFFQRFAFDTNKYWSETFNSLSKVYLQKHGADVYKTGRYTDAKDHTINQTDTKNLAISHTDTKSRVISQTDTKNRATSQADAKDGVMGQTDTEDSVTSQTDAKSRAVSKTGVKDRGIIPADAVNIVDQPISLGCPANNNSPPLDDDTRNKYEMFDLLRVKTPAFLSNYKNPCWKQDNPRKLVCLPYFYQIGFPKCGSTFTFDTIVGHPEAVMGERKEFHWLTRRRFTERSHLQRYLDFFAQAARVIESNVSTDSLTGEKFHPVITGDGSAAAVLENKYWRYLPGNYNCSEPRVLTPHYIYHLNPSTKIIIVIRNPTERIISMFNYITKGRITAESFHATVVEGLRVFEECCLKYPSRACVCDLSPMDQVLGGLYHVFIRDWMKVFPADQILIVRMEDIRDDIYRAFTRIYNFLGLSPVSRSELKEIVEKSKMNDKKYGFQAKNETRRLLDDFYRPHNVQLARLLHQHDPNVYPSEHDVMYGH